MYAVGVLVTRNTGRVGGRIVEREELMKREELPKECQWCLHLMCNGITMDGNAYYSCSRIPVFLKRKKTPCEKFYGIREDGIIRSRIACDYCKHAYILKDWSEVCTECNHIRRFEGLEVKRVVHAHWIEQKSLDGSVSYKCSNCGDVAYMQNAYCRICGANMDGE